MDTHRKSSDQYPLGKVLFLTSCYPKSVGEPSGIFIHHLARGMQNVGWEVVVLTPNFPGGLPSEVMNGVRVRRFTYFVPNWQFLGYQSGMLPNLRKSGLLWLQVPFYLLSLFFNAARILLKEEIAIIHAHWLVPQGLVARLLRSCFRKPLILTVHGGDAFAFRGPKGRFFKRWALRNVSVCTVNSSSTERAIEELGVKTPVHLIPMGVDIEHFNPRKVDSMVRQHLDISGPMILFVGRLVEKKGVRHLLQALPDVLEEFPHAVLVLIGDGAGRAHLEEMADQLRIRASTRFLGRIDNLQLPQYYTAADLFVGPSVVDARGDTEGLGIVFLEAAASGVPVIGTNVGGISEILIDGVTGIEVEPANTVQLAMGIKRLLRDPALRDNLVRQARQRVVSDFSWTLVASRFSSLYQDVIRGQLA